MSLAVDRILATAARERGRAAMLFEGRVVTYGQLLALVSNAARRFHDQGVRPGDVVGLAMGQSPLHLVAFLALTRIGAVTLPQFPNVPAADRARALGRYGARWLVADGSIAVAGTVRTIEMRDLHARGDERDFGFSTFAPAADAPMCIALTSGTTGGQKAFLITHGDFTRRVERRYRDETGVPRVVPPLLHITSAMQLAAYALACGGAVVFPHPGDARGFIAAIHLHAVTHVKLPPADLAALLSLLPEETPAFASIRQLHVIGGTPHPALVRLAQRKFSPHVFASYSMAELGKIAWADAQLLERHPGSAGRVLPDARAETIDSEGRSLSPGEHGEIRVRVEGMPQGFHGPDASLPGFRDGWFHPGDHGRVTADGLVYVEGRNDSLLNVGGHKVAPEFIESVLGQHASVAEVAVFGIDDELYGSRVAAAVIPRGTIDWKRLSADARDALGHSAPVRYLRVESLPRNEMGKLERQRLAEWCQARTVERFADENR